MSGTSLLKKLFKTERGPEAPSPAVRKPEPLGEFNSWHYIRHNQRRQEHLASLNLPIPGKTVLEIGAGIGDHTHFFINRDCKAVVTEGRAENVEILKRRYSDKEVHQLDMEQP